MNENAARSVVRKAIVLVVTPIFFATCANSGESAVIRTQKKCIWINPCPLCEMGEWCVY